MVRNVRDVLRSVPREIQEQGITRREVIQLFMKNGYGDRRAVRRTNEAIVGCQLQPIEQPSEDGELRFTCVWWPFARHNPDFDLVIATVTDRQGITHRIDDPAYKDKILISGDMYNL